MTKRGYITDPVKCIYTCVELTKKSLKIANKKLFWVTLL